MSSPEGFSISKEGLPEPATDAWYATVFVESRHAVWRMGQNPSRRSKRGAGIVVSFDADRNVAVIATNAHNITCDNQECRIRVGFSDPDSPKRPKWSKAVHVVSRNTSKDLAFIEVDIPVGARLRTASFASAECSEPGVERVLSIGWPDLEFRTQWGVQPPPNYKDDVKRYSDGVFLLWREGRRLNPYADRLVRRMQVIFHNADILPGSSGGPLVNRHGQVIGMNNMVVSTVGQSDDHRFCARQDPHDTGDCVHVAFASEEVISEFERLYTSRIEVSGCSSPAELEMGR